MRSERDTISETARSIVRLVVLRGGDSGSSVSCERLSTAVGRPRPLASAGDWRASAPTRRPNPLVALTTIVPTDLPAWLSVANPSTPVALGLAIVIAGTAWRFGSLRTSGALAAAVVGAVALRAGWPWGGFLLLWFAWATLASRLGRARKAQRTAGVVEKGAQRDAVQVLANGGVFAVAAATALLQGDPASQAALWGAAALAAAGADTLGTEIGTWVGGTPRSARDWRPVPAGTSGAVSVAGSVATLVTSLLLATVAVVIGLVPVTHWWIVAVAAVFGAIMDTLAGAMVQQRRWCPACEIATEQARHACGTDTRHRGGWRWLGNDEVNVVCTASAALLAWLINRAVA